MPDDPPHSPAAERSLAMSAPTSPLFAREPRSALLHRRLPFARHKRTCSAHGPVAASGGWRDGRRGSEAAAATQPSVTCVDDDDDDDDGCSSSSGSAMSAEPSERSGPSGVPRNRAVVRLMSLVEEDRQALAAEMEHEAVITRSIRHTSVQEWLRAAGGGSGGGSSASESTTARAASPAYSSSSAVSSPRLQPALPPARSLKRKSVDDAHPYKRQAMSPSGLRAQIAFARRLPTAAAAAAVPADGSAGSLSTPESPLTPRPMAVAAARARSRSGTGLAVLTAPPASCLSILQPNGGFSRMSIDDPMDEGP
ncbi:hypothetical protein GGI04_005054 [Coemansia thaxteri]|nr:hypothetical protein GGI04_005054 [Coemansia thaxteri]KAJ2465919.1 hypothetical protein GGI02_004543 [Coemansia sp. RSA 2322]